MSPHNLFSLITERLLLNASHIDIPTYNLLFEVTSQLRLLSAANHVMSMCCLFISCLFLSQLLTEKLTPSISFTRHKKPEQSFRIENPRMIDHEIFFNPYSSTDCISCMFM